MKNETFKNNFGTTTILEKMFYICKPLLAERQIFSPECEIIYNLNISNRIEFKSVKDIEYHSV